MRSLQFLRNHSFLMLLTLGVAACNGTSTGNPMNSTGGAPNTPPMAQLLKSNLSRDAAPALSQDDAATLGAGNRALAFDLYRQLAREDENLFFSPFSISVALAMAYAGAEAATENEMRTALHFDVAEPALHPAFNATLTKLAGRGAELPMEGSGTGFDLRVVNQAWGQKGYPFENGFLDVLAQNYGAGLYAVDFAASQATRQLINDWVEEQTETRIKDLLPADALSSDTRFVLTNAIYFKASWLRKFKAEQTLPGVFHAPSGDRSVSMMHDTQTVPYTQGSNYQAFSLPYLSTALSMIFVLPADGAFQAVSSAMNDAFFQQARAGFIEHDLTMALPKFQFESTNPLKPALSALGMPGAFTMAADFSDIAGGVEPLFIDEVYHKAFVALDEEGTEAAAATAVVGTTVSVKPSAQITLDRPFLFAIFDHPTQQLLFLGHVVAPD